MRFLSEDPIGFLGGNPNLYAYVANNPQAFRDPTGEFVWAPGIIGFGVGAVGGALGAMASPNWTGSSIALGALTGGAAGFASAYGGAGVGALAGAISATANQLANGGLAGLNPAAIGASAALGAVGSAAQNALIGARLYLMRRVLRRSMHRAALLGVFPALLDIILRASSRRWKHKLCCDMGR